MIEFGADVDRLRVVDGEEERVGRVGMLDPDADAAHGLGERPQPDLLLAAHLLSRAKMDRLLLCSFISNPLTTLKSTSLVANTRRSMTALLRTWKFMHRAEQSLLMQLMVESRTISRFQRLSLSL